MGLWLSPEALRFSATRFFLRKSELLSALFERWPGVQSAATSVGLRCLRKERIASTTVSSPALVLIMAW
jgi:hypothetical protein